MTARVRLSVVGTAEQLPGLLERAAEWFESLPTGEDFLLEFPGIRLEGTAQVEEPGAEPEGETGQPATQAADVIAATGA
jgi:hypothetical protein